MTNFSTYVADCKSLPSLLRFCIKLFLISPSFNKFITFEATSKPVFITLVAFSTELLFCCVLLSSVILLTCSANSLILSVFFNTVIAIFVATGNTVFLTKLLTSSAPSRPATVTLSPKSTAKSTTVLKFPNLATFGAAIFAIVFTPCFIILGSSLS